MTTSFQLSFINSHLSMNDQLSITNEAARKMVNGKYLVSSKWLMVNSSRGDL